MQPKKLLPIAAILLASTTRAQTEQAAPLPIPSPDEIGAKAWLEQHLEHRWLRFVEATRIEDPRAQQIRASWIQSLSRARDGDLLTWIAIYDNDTRVGEDLGAFKALLALDDPRWPAVALWTARGVHAGQFDRVASQQGFGSHGQESLATVVQPKVAVFSAWLRLHAPEDLDGRWLLLQMLQPANAPVLEAGVLERLAPPFRSDRVILQWLDVPKEVGALELEAEVDEQRRYRHQVLRALRGLGTAAMTERNYFVKAASLTDHEDVKIRAAAFRLFARIDPAFVTWRRFIEVAEDVDRSDDDRRRAVFALSHAEHPAAYWWMVDRFFSQEATPFDEMLATRLGEIDHGYAELRLLADSARDSTLPESRFAGVRQRLAGSRQVGQSVFREASAEACAVRLAWIRCTGHRGTDDFLQTTLNWLRLPGISGEPEAAAALFDALATWEPRAGVYPPRNQALRGDVHDARMAAAVRKAASDFAAALRIR